MAFEQLGDQNVLGGLNNQNIIRGEDQPHPVSKEDLNAFFTALSMLPYAGAIGQMIRGIGTTGRAMSRFEDGGAGPSSPKAPEPAPSPAPKFGPETPPSPETPPAPPSVPLRETPPAPPSMPSPVPSPVPSPAPSSSTWNTRQAVTGGARAFDYMGQPKVVVRGRDGHWTGQDSHGVYYTDRNYYNDGLYGNVADALAKAGGRVPAPAESSWHGLTRAIGEMTPEQFSEFMQRLEALRNARGAMPR